MPAIRLIPIDVSLAAAVDDATPLFERAYDVTLGDAADRVREVVPQTLAMVPAARGPHGGYLAVDAGTGQVVGTCACRADSTPHGEVEIAYFTFHAFEGQGYGSEMARSLIELALSASTIRRVIAHTLPERNASARILEKAGMRWKGEVVDPKDGAVWRWELSRPGPHSAQRPKHE